MDAQYYFLGDDGQTVHGPYGLNDVWALQTRGVIHADTQLCREGSEEWSAVAAFPELRPMPPPMPAPITVPPPVPAPLPVLPQVPLRQPKRNMTPKEWAIGLGFGVFFIGGISYYMAHQPIPAPSPYASSSYQPSFSSDGMYTTRGKHLAASTRAGLDKVTAYANAHDTAALARLVSSGQATLLKAGLQAQVMERESFGSVVKIRPKGTTTELWTYVEEIQ